MSKSIGALISYKSLRIPLLGASSKQITSQPGGAAGYLQSHPELTGNTKLDIPNNWMVSCYDLQGIFDNCVYVTYKITIPQDLQGDVETKLSVSRKPATAYAVKYDNSYWDTQCMLMDGRKNSVQWTRSGNGAKLPTNEPRLTKYVRSCNYGNNQMIITYAGLMQVDPTKHIKTQAESLVNKFMLEELSAVRRFVDRSERSIIENMKNVEEERF